MASPASSTIPSTGGLDGGFIAMMRLVLSTSVLFFIGPSDLDEPGLFHIIAALYAAYSALLYVFESHQVQPVRSKLSYWADICWAALLTAFGDDLSLAFFLLFPILIAALHWSLLVAVRLTLVSANLLTVISFVKAQMESELELATTLLPPIYLLVFGYMVARWGDHAIAPKRRLGLLKEISGLSNPRFGIDRTIGTMMERLRAFHDAEACVMIVTDPVTRQHLMRRADRRDPERAITVASIPPETARLLLAPPLEQAIIYHGAPRVWEWWRSSEANYDVFDVRKGRRVDAVRAVDDALVAMLDAEAFISVPLRYPDSTIGRLYLIAARRHAFSPADAGFLLQVIAQTIPVIENIRLVDQLASSAAEEERRRLARDIHDSVIQPYIGFQIGLAAVSQKLHAGASDITGDIAQLMAITEQGIGDLRGYVHRLPAAGNRENVLLAAVQRFAATFTEATHIAVKVEGASDLHINDRLAAEVFQMVVEGLSNIRRHTQATCASIGLACQNDCLIVQIVNDGANAAVPPRFIPRSIAERAAALGGQTCVEYIAGGTRVTVRIPL
jgi:signal transduction histidine kinase